MNGFLIGAVVCLAIVLILWWAARMDALEAEIVAKAEQQAADRAARRLIASLVDVTPEGALVSPRGLELELSGDWSHEDVFDVLATIEAL